MDVVELTAEEAERELIAMLRGMDLDDLALAVSELVDYEDKVVVVRHDAGSKHSSCAYLNGMSSDKRGDTECFTADTREGA